MPTYLDTRTKKSVEVDKYMFEYLQKGGVISVYDKSSLKVVHYGFPSSRRPFLIKLNTVVTEVDNDPVGAVVDENIADTATVEESNINADMDNIDDWDGVDHANI